ncbi:MAG: FlgO family outer membrane protein [Candidatus Binatia bacterium]
MTSRVRTRRLFLVPALFGVLTLLAACAATPAAKSAPAAQAKTARAEAPSSRRQTVAVFPFENNAVTGRERLDFLSEWLADSFAARLHESGELRVVERRELLKILEEQKLGSSALASKEGRLQLGKIAGAQTIVFGNFSAIEDVLQLNARIVDVESGVVLKTLAARGKAAEARAVGQQLSQDLGQGLGVTLARSAEAAALTDNRALQEAELFYRGVDQERRGEIDAAIESYRKALELDPNDKEARERLKKLLGASQ